MKIPLFKSKRQWTQGSRARTKRGMMCSADNKLATKWCLLGWLDKNTNTKEHVQAALAMEKCLPNIYKNRSLAVFNDNVSFKDVQKLIEDANRLLAQKFNV